MEGYLTPTEFAAKYDTSLMTVYKAVNRKTISSIKDPVSGRIFIKDNQIPVINKNEWMTVGEAAEKYGVTKSAVLNAIKRGDVESIKVPFQRENVLVKKSSIPKFAKGKNVKPEFKADTPGFLCGSINYGEKIFARLDDYCKRTNTTKSEIVRIALTEYLNKEEG